MGFREFVRHERSKSFPDSTGISIHYTEPAYRQKRDMTDINISKDFKKHSSNAEIQQSLGEEILLLEKRLQDQVSVRCALEKGHVYRASSHDNAADASIPKPATDLIREIAVLELEVGHLEQYLLSLYRKAFDQQMPSLCPKKNEGLKYPLETPRKRQLDFSRSDITSSRKLAPEAETQLLSNSRQEANDHCGEMPVDFGVQRSHSSLSQHSILPSNNSPPEVASGKSLRPCHSQPFSMMEYAGNSSGNVISLAEHLGTSISDHVPETPNTLSEDIVKSMCNIYFKLADPTLANNVLSSPTSSLSSLGGYSPKNQCGLWSPELRNESYLDVRLDNPFHVQGLKDFSGPYSTMIEVNRIYGDNKKLGDVEFLLENYRSLISRLEDVDPKKMIHEEKLAFWINVHNALVMHALLAYGIPQNNMKRMFLLIKAAYNVGGQIISADVIQNSILGCRLSRPGQWLRLLLPSKSKFRAGDTRQAYAIARPEPLLYFALSSGSHSDPAVRVYTAKRVVQELEAAKEDYIRATFGVGKDYKIILPKMIGCFAKDCGLSEGGMIEMIRQSLPDSLRKCIKKWQQRNNGKNIEWLPHNFTFRYLIMRELVNLEAR